MIETVLIICAIIAASPYYDCEQEWVVLIHDKYSIKSVYTDSWVSGYAVSDNWLDRKPIGLYHPELAQYNDKEWLSIGKLKRDSCWDDRCYPLLWHEMKHLKCNCNWHYDMTSMGLKDIFNEVNGT